MDLHRLSSIIDYSPDSGLVCVQAGTHVQDMVDWLLEKDRSLAVWLDAGENPEMWEFLLSPEMGRFGPRFGCKWDQVFSMSAVLPSGRVFRNSPAPARAAGPDFAAGILLSRGRLGIPLEVTLRVRRIPNRRTQLTFALPDPLAGIERVWAMAQDVNPVFLEVGFAPRERRSKLPPAFLVVELWEETRGLGITREQVRKVLGDAAVPAEIPVEALLRLHETYGFRKGTTSRATVERATLNDLLAHMVTSCQGRFRLRLRGFLDNQVSITASTPEVQSCPIPNLLGTTSYSSRDGSDVFDQVCRALDPGSVFAQVPLLWGP